MGIIKKKKINLKKLTFLIAIMAIMLLTPAMFGKDKQKGEIKFTETTYDFGTIKEKGGPVSHEFTFENTGTGNLVITDAKAECGCTVPEFPQAPIAPGKKGVIKVTYNPLGRPGGFTKVVTVRSNGSPSKVTLKIRGSVMPAK